jgi:hypothetical protein
LQLRKREALFRHDRTSSAKTSFALLPGHGELCLTGHSFGCILRSDFLDKHAGVAPLAPMCGRAI